MEYHQKTLLLPRNQGKGDLVRHVFENTSRYLKSRSVDIQFRIETVAAYAANVKRERVLDIGCGDGSISLQLLTPATRLTLMDISSNMIAAASANFPEGSSENVELRNENFATASFSSESFDLIVAVGVMAHVDSPDAFLEKIHGLLKPGGSLIVEFTDAFHFVGCIGRVWGWLKERIAPAKYTTNKVSYAQVAKLLDKHHFEVESVFRYSRVPIPGFNIVVNHAREYRLMKLLFGSWANNHNAWLGNEYICHLKVHSS